MQLIGDRTGYFSDFNAQDSEYDVWYVESNLQRLTSMLSTRRRFASTNKGMPSGRDNMPKIIRRLCAASLRLSAYQFATKPIPINTNAMLLHKGLYVEQYNQQINVYAGAFQDGGKSFGQKKRQYIIHANIDIFIKPIGTHIRI